LEIGVFTIHLVDDHDPGNAEGLSVLQGNFSADFETAHRIHQDQGTVCDAHRRNNLADKIGVPGCVEQVEFEILIDYRQNRGKERNAAALFFIIKVRDCGFVFNGAQAGDGPGEVKDALGEHRLAGIAMRGKNDVADGGG